MPNPLLSPAEMEALLGSPGGEEAAPRGDTRSEATLERWSVLMASRRADDARALTDRLLAHHAEVTAVRSSFRALDRIRANHYDAVVTDLELWADGGALLFQRIVELEDRPLVIFLSERDLRKDRALLSAGAAGVILSPLSPRQVELTVRQLLDALRVAKKPLSHTDNEATLPNAKADPEIGSVDGEVEWLRFLLEGQRVRHTHEARESFFGALAEVAREYVGARAVGITYRKGDGVGANVSACSLQDQAELASYLSAGRNRPAAMGDWVITSADETRMIFIGLPRPVWLALPVYESDVLRVLGESSAASL